MSGIVGLGTVAGMALRFPRTANAVAGTGSFMKRHWKWFAAGAAAIGLYFAASSYLGHRDQANFDRGFGTAEQQYRAALLEANARATETQNNLDLITQRFGFLAEQREGSVTTLIQPQIERITREVQSNPVYGACAITDGVFDATNAAVAGVNASIGAGAPVPAR